MLAGKNEPVHVTMYDKNDKNRGFIYFEKNYSGGKNFTLYPSGKIIAFMPLAKLQPTLDILRNEKPVYFAFNESYNWAFLKTGEEPTGEEEIS